VKKAVDWLFKSRETGKITIAQWPNIPLWGFIAATGLHIFVSWDPLKWVATLALAIWAALEIVKGVNPFRRAVGAVVLIAVLAL
jgi:hypothetical protein